MSKIIERSHFGHVRGCFHNSTWCPLAFSQGDLLQPPGFGTVAEQSGKHYPAQGRMFPKRRHRLVGLLQGKYLGDHGF